MAKKKPAETHSRFVEAILKVEETTATHRGWKQNLAKVQLPNGKIGEIYTDIGQSTIALACPGFPTRIVHLNDLISTMFYAE